MKNWPWQKGYVPYYKRVSKTRLVLAGLVALGFLLFLLALTSSGNLKGFAVFLLALMYLMPTVLAWMRSKRNAPMITVINFFLGWTVFGWCIALAWALTKEKVSSD